MNKNAKQENRKMYSHQADPDFNVNSNCVAIGNAMQNFISKIFFDKMDFSSKEKCSNGGRW